MNSETLSSNWHSNPYLHRYISCVVSNFYGTDIEIWAVSISRDSPINIDDVGKEIGHWYLSRFWEICTDCTALVTIPYSR